MIIECAGTRGSIARGGQEFSRFGGDTISVQITAKSGHVVIIDAGTGIQTFGNRLVSTKKGSYPLPLHLFFTHYHLDHIVGVAFFKPIYDKNQAISMYGPLLEGVDGAEQAFRNMLTPPYSPVSFDGHEIKASFTFNTIGEQIFEIGSLIIRSIRINHPNHGGLGYRVEEDGKSFVLLTDNELKHSYPEGRPFEDYVEFCRDADVLFHDAQFTRSEYEPVRGWGHSTIEDVVELSNAANCKEVGFFHYSPDRTDSDIDRIYTSQESLVSNGCSRFFPLTQSSRFEL